MQPRAYVGVDQRVEHVRRLPSVHRLKNMPGTLLGSHLVGTSGTRSTLSGRYRALVGQQQRDPRRCLPECVPVGCEVLVGAGGGLAVQGAGVSCWQGCALDEVTAVGS